MTYFILEISEAYTPPHLSNWYGKLDARTLKDKKAHELPKHMVFQVQKHMQMVFTDIILHPCFMVSKEALEVIRTYEPFLKSTRLLLYDRARRRSKDYHMLFLEEVDCLAVGSQFNLDRSVIHHATVDGDSMLGKSIVRVSHVNCICILIGLDLAENLLRSGLNGIGLRETETTYEGNDGNLWNI